MVIIMNQKNTDLIWKKLFKLSFKAFKKNEVPVAAIILKNNKIIASSYNLRETKHDVTAHAEVLVIKKAAKKLKRWNLNDCSLFVTLKPCSMCYEIIKQSRIENVYFYVDKPLTKKEFSKSELIHLENKNFKYTYQQLLSTFFKNKR